MIAHYKPNRKTNLVGVRLQEIDFEFLRKMADKHGVSISEQLRRIIKKNREDK